MNRTPLTKKVLNVTTDLSWENYPPYKYFCWPPRVVDDKVPRIDGADGTHRDFTWETLRFPSVTFRQVTHNSSLTVPSVVQAVTCNPTASYSVPPSLLYTNIPIFFCGLILGILGRGFWVHLKKPRNRTERL